MDSCQTPNCGKPLTRTGHKLCYEHWKQAKAGKLIERDGKFTFADRKDPTDGTENRESDGTLTASKLGASLDLSASRVNLILAELGWIVKFTKGWKVTDQGEKQGGQTRTYQQRGTPYVIWPDRLLRNKVFLSAVDEIGRDASGRMEEKADAPSASPPDNPQVADLRTRFPAKYRSADGHYVRSRAELSIDNWLYMQGIVHAYERKLPVEQDAYCDFYLPQNKVYIEFWGMEKDPAYLRRKKEKKAIYAQHNLNLVELADAELENLDDNLARLLIPFGVDCT